MKEVNVCIHFRTQVQCQLVHTFNSNIMIPKSLKLLNFINGIINLPYLELFIIIFRDIKIRTWGMSGNSTEPDQTAQMCRLAWLYNVGRLNSFSSSRISDDIEIPLWTVNFFILCSFQQYFSYVGGYSFLAIFPGRNQYQTPFLQNSKLPKHLPGSNPCQRGYSVRSQRL